jgi:YD repeat-containing protein
MWHVERDYQAVAGPNSLLIERTYNSVPYRNDGLVKRLFGLHWTTAYDAAITATGMLSDYSDESCVAYRYTGEIVCRRVVPTTTAIPDAVSIMRGNGKNYIFHRQGNTWVGDADTNDRLTAALSSDQSAVERWAYLEASTGSTEQYDGSGKLLSITARTGSVERLTYSDGLTNDTSAGRQPADAPICSQVPDNTVFAAGRLLCVTDNWGRQLNFKYDEDGRIVEVIDPAGQSTTYEYDGVSSGCAAKYTNAAACWANNLTKVTYPDGTSHTYYYNERANIAAGLACAETPAISDSAGGLPNSLTGLVDENGVRYINWTYDCLGRATSSELASGVEKVVLAYTESSAGAMATQVTHYVGDPANPQTTQRTFQSTPVLGVMKNTSVSGQCAECGSVAARTYDANGNIATSTDWNGVKTTYTYDLSRNLETSRTEAAGTAQARTITSSWHASYRLPLQIAEPKRLTTYAYDGSGNILTRTVQATSDASGTNGLSAALTGSPRTWTYSYNTVGQLLSITGPRTDVSDITRYAYDSMGNLSTITNAAGQVTTLSNYDANGLVGHIATPGGMVTDMGYTARGWLSSQTVTAGERSETTSYIYDGVGQLKQVTLPDASIVSYTYDDAHRLVAISDTLGNSIRYTLDLTGNRIAEQVSDASGALSRRVARVYSELNRLQQQTGSTR